MEYENCRIYKYTAEIDGDFDHPSEVPALIATFRVKNGTILDYGFQGSRFVLWMRVTPDLKAESTITRVLVPTGGAIPKNSRYLKTLQLDNGLVYHLFEVF